MVNETSLVIALITKPWRDKKKNRIMVVENYLYTTSLHILYHSSPIEIDGRYTYRTYDSNLSVYSTGELKKIEKVFDLPLENFEDASLLWGLSIAPPLVRDEDLLYYGGHDGVFILEISNPAKPSLEKLIQTDQQVVSLTIC
jgi:hypothetical protein